MLRPSAVCPSAIWSARCCARAWTRATRRARRCAECGRTPLIGERVHRYERDAVCELCRPRRRAEPLRTQLVLHLEHGLASRRHRAPAPSPPRPPASARGAALSIDSRPMDPFSVETTIARPRGEVFEYLVDVANHPEFTDHFLKDWHMTREETYGTRRRRALPRRAAVRALPVGRLVDRRDRARPRGSCSPAARASSTASARSCVLDAPRRPERHARRGHRSRPTRRCCPTVPRVARPAPRAEARLAQGAAQAALDPRGGPRARRARDDRRRGPKAGNRSARRVITRRRDAPLLLLVIAVAALGVSACGDKQETITAGESEAAYVTLGDLQYQVQISRQMNPRNVGDRAYWSASRPRTAASARMRSGSASGFARSTRAARRRRAPTSSRSSTRAAREFEPIPLAKVNASPTGRRHPGRGPAPTRGERVLRVLEHRRAAAVQAAGRGAQLPPARARVQRQQAGPPSSVTLDV